MPSKWKTVESCDDAPRVAAVYILLKGRERLYVGQTVNLRQRFGMHHIPLQTGGGFRIKFRPTDKHLLLAVEKKLIIKLRPKLNKNTYASSSQTRKLQGTNIRIDTQVYEQLRSYCREKPRRSMLDVADIAITQYLQGGRQERPR